MHTQHITGPLCSHDEKSDRPSRAGFFATLGLPLIRGSELAPQSTDTLRRVIINEAMARRYFAGRDAVGSRVRLGGPSGKDAEVVAVAADARMRSVSADVKPMIFVQSDVAGTTVLVRVSGDAEVALTALSQALHDLDPGFVLAVRLLRRE